MVLAGYAVEIIFGVLGLIPDERNAKVVEASVSWNYTAILNIVFLAIAGGLCLLFLRTGGPAMLRAMAKPARVGSLHDGREGPANAALPDPGDADPREYVCPMHPEVRQIGPGSCPKCGMPLVPVKD
jgi:hypothetical protein